MWKHLASVVCVVFFAVAAGSASAESLPTVAEILTGTIFGEDEIERVLAGKPATTPVREVSPRELGVGHACLVPAGRQASLEVLRGATPFISEEHRDASGPIDLDNLDASLAALAFGKGAQKEARRLLAIEPGYEVNLSAPEIATFRALEPAAGQEVEVVEAQLRKILAERVRAYRAGGTAAIAPFTREDGETSSPGDELHRSTEGMDGLKKSHPAFREALLAYPHGGLEHQEFWFWTRIRVLGRQVFMLHQRLASTQGAVEVVVERQIYSTHFLDVGQNVSATLPVQEGTLLFSIYRTWVDRWTGPGFAVGAKRKIGNKVIGSSLRELIGELRLCEGE